jgi:hypothetical protein
MILRVQQHKQISCQIDNAKLFESSSTLIEVNSEEIFNKLPFIKENMKFAGQARVKYDHLVGQNNSKAKLCDGEKDEAFRKCHKDLQESRDKEKELEADWLRYRGLVGTTLAGFWNGTTKTMEEFIFDLVKRNPSPTKQLINVEFKKKIPDVKRELIESKEKLEAQSVDVPADAPRHKNLGRTRLYDRLTDRTKIDLIEKGSLDAYFRKAVDERDDSMVKLLCRIEGQYTKGRDKLYTAIGVGSFAVGGVPGLVAKLSLPQRLTLTMQVANRTLNAPPATILRASAVAVDAAAFGSAYKTKCLEKGIVFDAKAACSSDLTQFTQSELRRIDENNCVLDAAISAAPAGITAALTTMGWLTPKIGIVRSWIQQKTLSQWEQEMKRRNPVIPEKKQEIAQSQLNAANEKKLRELLERQRANVRREWDDNDARRTGPRTLGAIDKDIKKLREIGYSEDDLSYFENRKWQGYDLNKLPLRLGPEGKKMKGDFVPLELMDSEGAKVKVSAYVHHRFLDSQFVPNYEVVFTDPITNKIVKKSISSTSIKVDPNDTASRAEVEGFWNHLDEKLNHGDEYLTAVNVSAEDRGALQGAVRAHREGNVTNASRGLKEKIAEKRAGRPAESGGIKPPATDIAITYSDSIPGDGAWIPDPKEMVPWTGPPVTYKTSGSAGSSDPTSVSGSLAGQSGPRALQSLPGVEVGKVYHFTATDSMGVTRRQIVEVTKILSTRNGPVSYRVQVFDEAGNELIEDLLSSEEFLRRKPTLASENDQRNYKTRIRGLQGTGGQPLF